MHGNKIEVKSRVTLVMLLCSFIAGACGLTLGLDNGLTGGVEDMDAFLEKFYPNIASAKLNPIPSSNPYCLFNDQLL